jgi:hypothetical protein
MSADKPGMTCYRLARLGMSRATVLAPPPLTKQNQDLVEAASTLSQ